MLTKNRITYLNQLKLKKSRDQFGEFIAEGSKLVSEFLESDFEISSLYALPIWTEKNKNFAQRSELEIISEKEMERISFLKTASEVLAVIKIPSADFNKEDIKQELSLVLDSIQDPGNLGTIIRTADWFGIKNIFCSENTVDVYNPKVVQATMGSLTRVNVFYTNIVSLLASFRKEVNFPIYGTYLEGNNIFEHHLTNKGFIIMGSEGSGISTDLAPLITEKILIPEFQNNKVKSESLNVSIATAIVCAEFRRRQYK